MKTRIEKNVIPPQPEEVVEHTVYTCDLCDVESEDQDNVEQHYGIEHTFERKLKFANYDFVEFSTEINYQHYHRARQDFHAGKWEGPGWYCLQLDELPCRCGQCHEYVTTCVWAESLLRGWLTDCQKKLDELNTLFDKLNLKR